MSPRFAAVSNSMADDHTNNTIIDCLTSTALFKAWRVSPSPLPPAGLSFYPLAGMLLAHAKVAWHVAGKRRPAGGSG